MKTEDIILTIQSQLPVLSPYFSTNLSIDSITLSGTTATVTTASAHNLVVSDITTIANVLTPVEIASFTETVADIEFITSSEHDLTLNPGAIRDQNQQIRITGSAGFDQVYRLKSTVNRETFVVYRDALPALPAETFYLQEQSIRGYNGLKSVTSVLSPTTFTFEVNFILPEPNFLEGSILATGQRISGAINYVTADDSYTEQSLDNLWLFVVLSDNSANKDRFNLNDADTTQGRQGDYNQKIISGFNVYIFVPNKGDILTKTNGRAARDIIEDIRVPLFRSLIGIDLGSDLSCPGQNVLTYSGDGFFDYNGARYVHEFRFQQVNEITQQDTAIESFSRAFRDIETISKEQFSDITTLLSDINLDDEPI